MKEIVIIQFFFIMGSLTTLSTVTVFMRMLKHMYLAIKQIVSSLSGHFEIRPLAGAKYIQHDII